MKRMCTVHSMIILFVACILCATKAFSFLFYPGDEWTETNGLRYRWMIPNWPVFEGFSFDCYAEIAKGPEGAVSVSIPSSVTFYEANEEMSQEVGPLAVLGIGLRAFRGYASLKNVSLPVGLKYIGQYAFYGCVGLDNITFPNSITNIGSSAFAMCEGLVRVEIPRSVETIGRGAFYGCNKLKSIDVDAGNTVYSSSANGLLLTKSGGTLICCPSGLTDVTVPESVRGIESYAFAGCVNLEYVTLPDRLKVIGEDAFSGCHSLKTIIIPEGVAAIDTGTFAQCYSLTDVVIPKSVTCIEQVAFAACSSLTNITFMGDAPYAPDNGYGNFTQGLDKSKCIVRIATSAKGFVVDDNGRWNGLSVEYYDNGGTPISGDDGASDEPTIIYSDNGVLIDVFMNGFDSITVPEGVKSIYDYAFAGCVGLYSVEIPNSVTNIGERAFYGCESLKSVIVPENVAHMGVDAFDGCEALEVAVLPDGLGDVAFSGCSHDLQIVYYTGECPAENDFAIATLTFDATGGSVPKEFKKVLEGRQAGNLPIPDKPGYRFIGWFADVDGGDMITESSVIEESMILHAQWIVKSEPDFFTISADGVLTSLEPNGATSIVIPDNVVSIEEWVFCDYCRDIEDIIFPSSVTDIGYGAFYGCTNLVSVTFSEGLKSIGESAFAGCSSLTEVVLPDSLESLGPKSFQGCDSLVSVSIGTGISNVGDGAFGGSPLEDLHLASIDSWLNSVVASPFGSQPQLRVYVNDSLLTDLTIPEGVTTIGEGAFKGWASLQSVRLPESLTSIGEYSFAYCSSLKSINIPDGIVEIPNYAFDRCSNLEDVSIGANVASVGDMAFFDCNCIKRVYISNLSAWCAISFDNRYESSAWANPLYYASEGLWLDGNPLCGAVEIPKRVTDEYGGERDNITYIAPYAFKGCSGITSIKIPSSVTNISQFAFVDCSALQTIYIPKTLESEMQSVSFWQCPSNVERVYYVEPEFTISYGQLKSVKLNGATEVVIPDGVTAIGDWYGNPVFDTPYLEKVVIPDSVMELRFCAFAGCTELTSIVIPNSVTSIGSQAFSRCPKLDIVVLPRWFQGRESEIFDYDQIPKMRIVYYDGDTPSLSDLNYVTIMFDANGGVVSEDRKEFLAGYALGELPEAVFQGFGFKGWYTLPDGGSLVTTETILEADVILYAHWAECVEILYDATGGSVAEGLQYVISGEAIGNMPTPVKAGFAFKGWYTLPAGGTLVTVATVLNSNITLYAHWEEQPFSFEGEEWAQETDGSWKSGRITDYEQTSIIKNVSGVGILSFSWNVSSESGYDELIFYIDGESKDVISGTAGGWAEKTYDLDSDGIHTLKWTYSKDGSVSRGDDCGWIKDVVWIAAGYEAVPSIPDDPSAVITGDAEIGYTIKPGEDNKAVVVTIPDGVAVHKVTVEVSVDVSTVTANGANVKVMKGGHDIAEHLDLDAVTQNGVINLASAQVKETVVKETLDTQKGAEVDITDPEAPQLTTSETKPGLTYTLLEGTTLEEMMSCTSGDSTLGNGKKWSPTITVKGGASGFYTIKVEK